MPTGLTDPLTALSFSAMSVDELAGHHRELRIAQREINHWRRLLNARIDLAVAAVADLEEPRPPVGAASYCCADVPPAGLRELLGIATRDDRLSETALLIRLRAALSDLDTYVLTLDAVTDEAGYILTCRLGTFA